MWLALTPEVAKIYGYVRRCRVHSDAKLIRMDDPEVVKLLQTAWTTEYCELHPRINKSAFANAFYTSRDGKAVRRNSEFEGDAIVVQFLQWWAHDEWHGFEAGQLFEDDHETTSHHAEVLLFEPDKWFHMDEDVLPLDYNHDNIRARQHNKQRKRRSTLSTLSTLVHIARPGESTARKLVF
jgi:hypothetical protein